jgi:hypothetical protein
VTTAKRDEFSGSDQLRNFQWQFSMSVRIGPKPGGVLLLPHMDALRQVVGLQAEAFPELDLALPRCRRTARKTSFRTVALEFRTKRDVRHLRRGDI